MLAMERFPHPTTGGGAPRPGEKDRYDLAVRLARRYFVVPFVVGCAVALGLSTGVRPPPPRVSAAGSRTVPNARVTRRSAGFPTIPPASKRLHAKRYFQWFFLVEDTDDFVHFVAMPNTMVVLFRFPPGGNIRKQSPMQSVP